MLVWTVGYAVGAVAAGLVGLDGWWRLGAAGLLGVVAMQLRIVVWRRRHPRLSPDEYVERMSRNAHLN